MHTQSIMQLTTHTWYAWPESLAVQPPLTVVCCSRGVCVEAGNFIKVTYVNCPGVGRVLFHEAICKMGRTRQRCQAVTGGIWSSTWSCGGDCKDGSTTQKY